MESVLIEYFRFDDLNTGVLSGGKKYILTHKDLPVKEVTTTIDQLILLDKLSKCLRYKSEISNEEKWKTIVEISGTIKEIFIDILQFGYENCQLDVVLNASELGLLPFELLLDEKQAPYFANSDKKISFTRRLRQNHFETAFPWPFTPRVLFVYSHGGSFEVPFENHLYELDVALAKWGGVQNPKIFQILEGPTFDELSDVIRQNDSALDQFTHVHFLAHGDLILDKNRPYDYEYGIVFGKEKEPPTPTQSIKELFESLKNKPFLVNYMICDGANFSNPLKPDKNPVQVTHKAGVPIVLGSQYPLSMNGSTLITRHLYSSLFNGEDIRETLYQIRVKLFSKKEDHHDWISLVSYARLPEGYTDYLSKLSIYCQMQNLKSTKNKTDAYLNKRQIDEDEFHTSISQLLFSINWLERKNEIENNKKYEDEVLENLGLLGSAYKRLAELYFIKSAIKGSTSVNELADQRSALKKSLEYYKRACDKNLSHYWSLVQYLSLDSVLHTQMTDKDYWFSARKAISNSILNKPGDGWAYASLLELLLLNTDAGSSEKEKARHALDMLMAISEKENNSFLQESTWHQINRYRTWWIKENGFAENSNTLSSDKIFLDELLSRLKAE